MLEIFFKNKEAKHNNSTSKLADLNLSASKKVKADQAVTESQSKIQYSAKSYDESMSKASCSIVSSAAEILAKPIASQPCLNDIFSDIIGEQPVFAVQTK